MIGSTISHYMLLERLGESKIGVVYKARDIQVGRLVVLRILPDQPGREAEQSHAFERAKAAAILHQPNICTLIEAAISEGHRFIVLEYVDGATLRKRFAEHGLQLQDCLEIAEQVGDALQEGHGKGFIHGDLKPENIMLDAKGRVKVMDFGLIDLKTSFRPAQISGNPQTIAYCAPEQIQGGAADELGDIYSFGVLLYEMIAGKLPIQADNETMMTDSILNDSPALLSKIVPLVPPELSYIVNRALEKEPGNRYESMTDLLVDLRGVPDISPSQINQVSLPGYHRRPKIFTRTYLLIALGIALLLIIIDLLVTQGIFSSGSGKPAGVNSHSQDGKVRTNWHHRAFRFQQLHHSSWLA